MRVIFRPSLEEHIEFLTARQKQNRPRASNAVTWIIFAFNLGFVPALLLFNDLLWSGIIIFVVNALMMIFLLSWQQTENLRTHYLETWPQLELHDCEITIDENVVESKHAGNRNSFPWTNVRCIGSTDRLIFFDVGTTQVLVSRRGFANDEEAKQFIALAKGYQEAQITSSK